MSLRRATTLEDFLAFLWKLEITSEMYEPKTTTLYTQVTLNRFAPLVALYEKWREVIEIKLSEFKGGDDGAWLEYVDYVNNVPELIKTQAREYVHLVKEAARRQPPVRIIPLPTLGKSSLLFDLFHGTMLEQLSTEGKLILDSYPLNTDTLMDRLAIHGEAYNQITYQFNPLDHDVKLPRNKRIPHMQRAESKRGGPRGRK
jgi:hypothetical protein